MQGPTFQPGPVVHHQIIGFQRHQLVAAVPVHVGDGGGGAVLRLHGIGCGGQVTRRQVEDHEQPGGRLQPYVLVPVPVPVPGAQHAGGSVEGGPVGEVVDPVRLDHVLLGLDKEDVPIAALPRHHGVE